MTLVNHECHEIVSREFAVLLGKAQYRNMTALSECSKLSIVASVLASRNSSTARSTSSEMR